MSVKISVSINGKKYTSEVEPRQLLVYHLREALRLTGSHVGCDTSSCGACTVLVDGQAVKSCTTLAAQVDGIRMGDVADFSNFMGAVIDGEHVLKSVQSRAVAIGPRNGVATVSLELPPLPPPATGVPTPAVGGPVPAVQPAPVFVPPPGQNLGAPIMGVPGINNPNALRQRQARAAGMGVQPMPNGAEPVAVEAGAEQPQPQPQPQR